MKASDRFGRQQITAVVLAILFFPSELSFAQWSAGVSYEIRNKAPTDGLGLRAERQLPPPGRFPADVHVRAHFGYFTEYSESYRHLQVPVELDAYDFGLMALASVRYEYLQPFAGTGFGGETYHATENGVGPRILEDSNIYWNLSGGLRTTFHPLIQPFIEYRFTKMFGTKGYTHSMNSRVAIGLDLAF